MSNCIDFTSGYDRLVIPRGAIDVEALQALLTRVETLPAAPQDEADAAGRLAWWFLDGAVELRPKQVIVHLGHGRSMHTWRDFKGTLETLAAFMRAHCNFMVYATDEADGHAKVFRLDVGLWRGGFSLHEGAA